MRRALLAFVALVSVRAPPGSRVMPWAGEFRVNTYTTSDQRASCGAGNSFGNFVV